jgi:hypothetical protein
MGRYSALMARSGLCPVTGVASDAPPTRTPARGARGTRKSWMRDCTARFRPAGKSPSIGGAPQPDVSFAGCNRGRHPNKVELCPGVGSLPRQRKRRAKLASFKNEHALARSKTEALISRLLENEGKVVQYDQLCSVLGYGSSQKARHLLQQYALRIKQKLAAKKAPYTLAVAHHVGYALCRIARR